MEVKSGHGGLKRPHALMQPPSLSWRKRRQVAVVGEQVHAIPVGFRFDPTDEELLVFYLANKVFDRAAPGLAIPELDVYGDKEPWRLRYDLECGGEFYCYARLRRAKAGNVKVLRAAGKGWWSGKGACKAIFDAGGGRLIGHRRTLKFVRRGEDGKETGTRWLMDEYVLDADAYDAESNPKVREIALCRIKDSGRGSEGDDDDVVEAFGFAYSCNQEPRRHYHQAPPVASASIAVRGEAAAFAASWGADMSMPPLPERIAVHQEPASLAALWDEDMSMTLMLQMQAAEDNLTMNLPEEFFTLPSLVKKDSPMEKGAEEYVEEDPLIYLRSFPEWDDHA